MLLLVAALGNAPMQCSGDPDPNLRRHETPGEALYGLSQEFKAKGDTESERATLEYLIAHYPNSRFAKMARDDLEKAKSK
jgi:TolA-binding protein